MLKTILRSRSHQASRPLKFADLLRPRGLCVVSLFAGIGCSSPPPPEAPEAPSLESSPEGDSTSSSLSEAEEAIGAGDFQTARELLEQVTREQPKNGRAHYYMGVSRQNLGQNAEAIASYRKATELAPALVEAWVNLTAAMLDEGDAAGAEAAIKRGLSRHPSDAGLLYNRALALGAQGKKEEAVSAYEAALAADPGNVEVKYGYAEALVDAGAKEKATSVLRELAKADSVEVLASSARLFGRLQDFDACIAALDKALGLQKSSELFVSRGLCQHGKKREAAAFEDFQRAVQADASYAPAHYYVGMHLKLQGKKAEARAALTKARDLGGSEGVGKAAQRALESL